MYHNQQLCRRMGHITFFLAKLLYRTLEHKVPKRLCLFLLKNSCPWYLSVGQLEQFMVTSKPLWRSDDKVLRQSETGQRAFSCYFLVFMFAGLTSLCTRTTSVHNISCDGLQSWQTEKQHENSPCLQHPPHTLTTSLPHCYYLHHCLVRAVLNSCSSRSPGTLAACVLPAFYRQAKTCIHPCTHTKHDETQGATARASVYLLPGFLPFRLFPLSARNPKCGCQIRAIRRLTQHQEQVLQSFSKLHSKGSFLSFIPEGLFCIFNLYLSSGLDS